MLANGDISPGNKLKTLLFSIPVKKWPKCKKVKQLSVCLLLIQTQICIPESGAENDKNCVCLNRPFHEYFFPTFYMDKLGNNPSTVKLSQLESDLLKIKEDIAPQSREKV